MSDKVADRVHDGKLFFKCGGRMAEGMADKKIHVDRYLTPHIDAFTRVREHIHTRAATRIS